MTTYLRMDPCISKYSVNGIAEAGAVLEYDDIESSGYFGFIVPPGGDLTGTIISNVTIECIEDCI